VLTLDERSEERNSLLMLGSSLPSAESRTWWGFVNLGQVNLPSGKLVALVIDPATEELVIAYEEPDQGERLIRLVTDHTGPSPEL